MAKQQKTEDQLKADIFNVYTRYLDEPSSDRRQVYFVQLCDFIFRWCKNYLYKKDTDEMGVEITKTVLSIIKIRKEEMDFFGYLINSLGNAQKQYNRSSVKGFTKAPRILKNIEKILSEREGNIGRKLSANERVHCLCNWYSWPEKKSLEWLKLLDRKFEGDDELGNENPKNVPIVTIGIEDDFITRLDVRVVKEALEHLLQNTQDRTRECYRSLFTMYCIDKSMVAEDLIPLLDNEIFEAYRKDGKKPNNYEIYLKYHPEVKKESAWVRASDMLNAFLKKLRTAAALNKKH